MPNTSRSKHAKPMAVTCMRLLAAVLCLVVAIGVSLFAAQAGRGVDEPGQG